MSRKGGFIGGYDPLAQDPIVYSGKWNLTEQMQAIAAGTWTGLPIVGAAYSWGYDSYGNLGRGNTSLSPVSSPTQIGAETDFQDVSVGYTHTLWKRGGAIYSAGDNDNGQLGYGPSPGNASSPTQIGSDIDWDVLGTSDDGSFCIKTSGALYSWGRGSLGVNGQNDGINTSSPVQLGALTNWVRVGGRTYCVLGIKSDGTLWGWAGSTLGELGITPNGYISSPTQIGSDTDWTEFSAGVNNNFFFKGTSLYVTGYNTNGELGLNDRTARSSPVQITGEWTSVSSWDSTWAVRSDGTLWAWGNNNDGECGLNDRVGRSSPVQVGSLTNWSTPMMMSGACFAIKTDGTLWSTGNGAYTADNTNINRSSPVQIGSATDWIDIGAGANGMTGIRQV